MRACAAEMSRVAPEMNTQDISLTLWAFAKLTSRDVNVDEGAVRAGPYGIHHFLCRLNVSSTPKLS